MDKVAVRDVRSSRDFWADKKVLITGHSGFKGAWLSLWLQSRGSEVVGLSLRPHTSPNLHDLLGVHAGVKDCWCDIRNISGVLRTFEEEKPEIVFHLAAQSLVRPGYRDPAETFAVNVQGTVNILEAVRHSKSVKAVVAITTDKVYRNNDSGRAFREDDPLGGYDPYSASKAAAEMVVSSYRSSFFNAAGIGLTAARAGNVIGGGDWSEDRILPDAVRAWSSDQPLIVRNPASTRPWQHVLEPLSAYMALAEFLYADPAGSGDFNFGPDESESASVRQVVEKARASFGRGEVKWGAKDNGPHEAKALSLDNTKAHELLGIRPLWGLNTSIVRTMNWYRRQLDGEDARKLCLEDIKAFGAGV